MYTHVIIEKTIAILCHVGCGCVYIQGWQLQFGIWMLLQELACAFYIPSVLYNQLLSLQPKFCLILFRELTFPAGLNSSSA